MVKHILTIIWNQRRSNGWIFAELLVVVSVLWVMMDSLLVDQYTYYSPLGFQIENTYKVNLGVLTPGTPGYVEDTLLTTRPGEDVMRLGDNLKQNPQVEEVSFSTVGCPYTWNNMWGGLVRADADTSTKAGSYQMSRVTSEYFDILRFTDKEGNPLRPIVEKNEGEIVFSADIEKYLFGDESAVGKHVKYDINNTDHMTISAVSSPIRQTEYRKSSPCFYQVLSLKNMMTEIESQEIMGSDCLIRMKPGFRVDDMDAFLQSMEERLTVNNIYVSSIIPLNELRTDMLKDRQDNLKKKLALVGFMLVNVFFGIIGTFWLRTQQRRGEIGLRVALGSNRNQLHRFMNMEGLCLLVLTIPFVLVFILNMLYFDMPDTYRLPYTWWRFMAAFGGAYALLASMIYLGIWFPISQVNKMAPSDALRYE